jgi:hypothetical protein
MYFILRPYFFKKNIPLTQNIRALPEDQQRPRGTSDDTVNNRESNWNK